MSFQVRRICLWVNPALSSRTLWNMRPESNWYTIQFSFFLVVILQEPKLDFWVWWKMRKVLKHSCICEQWVLLTVATFFMRASKNNKLHHGKLNIHVQMCFMRNYAHNGSSLSLSLSLNFHVIFITALFSTKRTTRERWSRFRLISRRLISRQTSHTWTFDICGQDA